jgi:hypothetical protein
LPALAAILAVLTALPAAAAGQEEWMPDARLNGALPPVTRADLYKSLDAYLAALKSHDPTRVNWAPSVRNTENNVALIVGDGLWATVTALGPYDLRMADTKTGQVALFTTATETEETSAMALRLKVEALGGVTQLVAEGKAVLGISNPMHNAIEGLEHQAAGAVRLVPVAAPDHPLARPTSKKNGGGKERARDHTQLVLTDRSPLTEGQDFGVLSDRNWRLGDLSTKHALLLAGLGWGNMPEFMIRDDLKAKRLVVLKLRDWTGGDYQLQAVWRRANPPGPAARWLVERFTAQP